MPSFVQANCIMHMSLNSKLDMDMLYQILGEEKPSQREKLKILSILWVFIFT